ncbi:MAG: OFA family MFS transporter, partial [Proteobacteria bacterium]|nr:OFA family MFS transporter [Pseudomonadota bacterium]
MNARLETKRWFIALAAVLIQLCLGTVYAWSVFKNELVANQGWDEVATSAAFMICIAFVGVAAGFGGVLMDKKGPRYVALLSGVFFGLGTMIGGIGVERQNIYLLYFGYGFIAGSANGFGYVTPIATLLHWFPDKRGLVTGLAVMGFGAGAFFMGKIAPAQIAAWGVAHTLYIWGAVYFILICGSALFFKNPPDGWLPEGYKPQTKTAMADARSMSFSEAIRSIQWWTLWGILVLHITAGIGLISQLAPIAKELYRPLARADISSEQLALATDAAGGLLVAIASIFNGLGRLFWAWLSDFFGRRTIFFVIFLSQAILYGVIPLVSNYYLFMLIACYVLACYGGGFATMPAFAADA